MNLIKRILESMYVHLGIAIILVLSVIAFIAYASITVAIIGVEFILMVFVKGHERIKKAVK